MSRITPVYRPGDHPGLPDTQIAGELGELFEYLQPNNPDPQIDRAHAGIAIAAQNPQLALHLAKLSRFIALELPWCERTDLRELAIQTLNLHFKCDFAFQARWPHAQAAGIRPELQAAIPFFKTTPLFDDEQRLVIEYTRAVISGDVPEALFARVVERYGEKGAVEFTTAVGWWSFWAMLLNAVRPEFEAAP
jgi:alkylhydroperoxidase family enzyme